MKDIGRLTEDGFEEDLDRLPFEFVVVDFFKIEFSFAVEIPLFICCHTASTLALFSGFTK